MTYYDLLLGISPIYDLHKPGEMTVGYLIESLDRISLQIRDIEP